MNKRNNTLSKEFRSIKLYEEEEYRKTIIKIEDTKTERLNLFTGLWSTTIPCFIKIISKIKTLIIADIELPIAIPICPKPKVKARI